jgi:hypothetical protein
MQAARAERIRRTANQAMNEMDDLLDMTLSHDMGEDIIDSMLAIDATSPITLPDDGLHHLTFAVAQLLDFGLDDDVRIPSSQPARGEIEPGIPYRPPDPFLCFACGELHNPEYGEEEWPPTIQALWCDGDSKGRDGLYLWAMCHTCVVALEQDIAKRGPSAALPAWRERADAIFTANMPPRREEDRTAHLLTGWRYLFVPYTQSLEQP